MMLNITENIVEIDLQFDFILKCHLNVMVCYALLGAQGHCILQVKVTVLDSGWVPTVLFLSIPFFSPDLHHNVTVLTLQCGWKPVLTRRKVSALLP